MSEEEAPPEGITYTESDGGYREDRYISMYSADTNYPIHWGLDAALNYTPQAAAEGVGRWRPPEVVTLPRKDYPFLRLRAGSLANPFFVMQDKPNSNTPFAWSFYVMAFKPIKEEGKLIRVPAWEIHHLLGGRSHIGESLLDLELIEVRSLTFRGRHLRAGDYRPDEPLDSSSFALGEFDMIDMASNQHCSRVKIADLLKDHLDSANLEDVFPTYLST